MNDIWDIHRTVHYTAVKKSEENLYELTWSGFQKTLFIEATSVKDKYILQCKKKRKPENNESLYMGK